MADLHSSAQELRADPGAAVRGEAVVRVACSPTVTAVVRTATDPGPIRVGYRLFSFFILLTVAGIKRPR